MLRKYYYKGKSTRHNDKFYTLEEYDRHDRYGRHGKCVHYEKHTKFDGQDKYWEVTVPFACENIRKLVSKFENKYNIVGYKRCLYLEKPDNTNRYWNIVIAIWYDNKAYYRGEYPERVVRLCTDTFYKLVPHQNGKDVYVKEMNPFKTYRDFARVGAIDFY